MERVQSRVTKTTDALRGYEYEERLRRLGLETGFPGPSDH